MERVRHGQDQPVGGFGKELGKKPEVQRVRHGQDQPVGGFGGK